MEHEAQEHQRHATACLVRLIRWVLVQLPFRLMSCEVTLNSSVHMHDNLGNSGLLFTCQALQNMQADKEAELHVCFRRSYDAILKHHHSFIIRSVVTVSYFFTSKM